MKVKVKKLNKAAVIPKYAKNGDVGLDLTAINKWVDENDNFCYGTGLAVEIPEGHFGMLVPRSSCSNTKLIMSNSIGIIDSGYRGEIIAKFKAHNHISKNYEVGDRIAQLIIMPYPHITLIETNELSETERGTGGYGSTGN